jgi:hypothetical protein
MSGRVESRRRVVVIDEDENSARLNSFWGERKVPAPKLQRGCDGDLL